MCKSIWSHRTLTGVEIAEYFLERCRNADGVCLWHPQVHQHNTGFSPWHQTCLKMYFIYTTESLRQGKKSYHCCSFPTEKVKWRGPRLPPYSLQSSRLRPFTLQHTLTLTHGHSHSYCTAVRTTESPAGRVTRQQLHPLAKIKPPWRQVKMLIYQQQ